MVHHRCRELGLTGSRYSRWLLEHPIAHAHVVGLAPTDQFALIELHCWHFDWLATIELIDLGLKPGVLELEEVNLSSQVVDHLLFGV